jgi:hypothetical protein
VETEKKKFSSSKPCIRESNTYQRAEKTETVKQFGEFIERKKKGDQVQTCSLHLMIQVEM